MLEIISVGHTLSNFEPGGKKCKHGPSNFELPFREIIGHSHSHIPPRSHRTLDQHITLDHHITLDQHMVTLDQHITLD